MQISLVTIIFSFSLAISPGRELKSSRGRCHSLPVEESQVLSRKFLIMSFGKIYKFLEKSVP